ncbi:MAG: ACT domain-containing protein, partial [Victivallales bacterium]
QLVISVMAKDRPGIVADVTGIISDFKGNLADLSQTTLCGYFTMILVASFPDGTSTEKLREALSEKGGSRNPEYSFEIGIKETSILKREESSPSESMYILTADGEDQIGLVAKVSAFCKKHRINILDLSTRADNDRYTMILLLDISSVKSLSGIRKALGEFSHSTGLNTELQHRDIFVATNEI